MVCERCPPRLDRHFKSGLKVAQWLSDRPEVASVIHPALADDPGHSIWKRDFSGASGLFAFILKSSKEAKIAEFLNSTNLFGMGYSWGGFESLLIPFDPTSYRTATKWNNEGTAFRIHIGLEDPEDLIEDLVSSFEAMNRISQG